MWTAAVAAHLNANKPTLHEWAFHAIVKNYGDDDLVAKGVWTGPQDLAITLGGTARVYEGAMGGINVGPIRYRIGTIIMMQDLELALSPEGNHLVRAYNLRNAPCDLYCLVYDPADMSFLGERRFFSGFIDSVGIKEGQQGEASIASFTLASQARKGTMTTTGKKSNASQKERLATDTFRKYADLGRVSSDMWGKG